MNSYTISIPDNTISKIGFVLIGLLFLFKETTMREERERATDANVKAGSAASRELNQLREELTQLKKEAQENGDKLSKVRPETRTIWPSL